MEGAATTVYAQGGRGNARLIAWEGERTVTFTMEDALISAMGFSVLTGAGLVDATEKPLIVHKTEQVQVFYVDESGSGDNRQVTSVKIRLSERPFTGEANAIQTGETTYTYTLVGDNGKYNAQEEYYKKLTNENTSYERAYDVTPLNFADKKGSLYTRSKAFSNLNKSDNEDYIYVMLLDENGEIASEPYIASETSLSQSGSGYEIIISNSDTNSDETTRKNDLSKFTNDSIVLVDYYVRRDSGAYQIDITPDKFGGNFYLEASTLFRATNGVDMPAEFIIPNCKIQSNFTFTMAASGDPSTFTFTMDAFPDYTRWDRTKKVYAAIQVIEQSETLTDLDRLGTPHNTAGTDYDAKQRPKIEL